MGRIFPVIDKVQDDTGKKSSRLTEADSPELNPCPPDYQLCNKY